MGTSPESGLIGVLRTAAHQNSDIAFLLSESGIAGLAEEFDAADRDAVRFQKRYKLWGEIAIATRFMAIAAGIAAFLPGAILGSVPGAEYHGLTRWAVAIQYLSLASGLLIAALLAKNRLFDRWMAARTSAESSRVALIEEIVATPHPNLRSLESQFEFFCRYHLDSQRRYFDDRGAEHRDAVDRTRRATRIASIMGIVSAMPVLWVIFEALGFVSFSTAPINQGFLLLGTIAAASLSALDSISRMNLDSRNAVRYAFIGRRLEEISAAGLNTARSAAKRGEREAVMQFVKLVNGEILQEYREWQILRGEFAPRSGRNMPKANS